MEDNNISLSEHQLEIPQFEKPNRIISLLEQEKLLDNESLSVARAEDLDRLYGDTNLPDGFIFDKEGWLTYLKDTDSENSPTVIRICSKLEVVARTRDQVGENHGRLLRFFDLDNLEHSWAMPMQLLATDGAVYRQELLSKGLLIDPGKSARQLLTIYIQTSRPNKTVRCVDQTGWNKELKAFVFQNETIGNCGDEPLILQTATGLVPTQSVSGSILAWKQIPAQCVGNSRLIFALSAAFAPPLLLPLGLENGGVHFRGGSSSGKTTCLRAAASVWGGSDYLQQWRATANGLEGTAAAHNDSLLVLDEMGQMDGCEIGKVAYMLANGTGKTRSDKLGDSRKRKNWRLLFLSSGEISLSDHMLEAKQKVRAGQEVRVLDIPADGQEYGCFQNLHGAENGQNFAEQIGYLCQSFYGSAGIEFIRCLLEDQKKIISFSNNLMAELSKKFVPASASGQVYRAFNRFSLIAIAGELATNFGITGWNEGVAIEAAMHCFNDWLRARGDIGSQEEREIISHAHHFFEQHGESRFTPWVVDDQEKYSKTFMRVGFRRSCEEGEEFYVFPESFKREICKGFDPELFARVCLKNKLLMADSKGGATRSERLPGAKKSTRVYRFTSKVLTDEKANHE